MPLTKADQLTLAAAAQRLVRLGLNEKATVTDVYITLSDAAVQCPPDGWLDVPYGCTLRREDGKLLVYVRLAEQSASL